MKKIQKFVLDKIFFDKMSLDKMLLDKILPWPNVTLTKCYLTKVNMTKCYLDEMLLWQIVLDEILLIHFIPPHIAYLKKWTTRVAILIVHLDPWDGFCHPCYLKIWIHVWKNLDSCLKKWTTSCCGPFGCRSQCSPWPSTWHLSHLKTRNSDSDWKIGI